MRFSGGKVNNDDIAAMLAEGLTAEKAFVGNQAGDAKAAISGAAKKIEAVYSYPYQNHATMEPMNCTAQVKGGQVEVWAPTQVPGMARAVAAQVAGVSVDQVTVHVTQLGGGFGRRLEVDYVAQAVQVAMACAGKPVMLKRRN